MLIVSDDRDRLFADAREHDVSPLWTMMDAMVPPHPKPAAVPKLWAYDDLRPLLTRAGQLVGTDEAERRVFMLINPAMRPPYTTDTLYAGLQLILPGETARAHRHVAFALRFIVEGGGAFTAVGGERVTMERGDLVLTPSWTWHDHGNDSDLPMVWLDGLDLPIYQAIPVNFAEPYNAPRYPSSPGALDSPLKFAWPEMAAKLDAVPGPFAAATYVNKKTGAPISRIIGAAAERIAAGRTSPRRRETTSAVYHVVSGTGTSRVDGVDLHWKASDTFAVPAWAPFVHSAHEDAYLFRFDDRPLIDALGAYRSEAAG